MSKVFAFSDVGIWGYREGNSVSQMSKMKCGDKVTDFLVFPGQASFGNALCTFPSQEEQGVILHMGIKAKDLHFSVPWADLLIDTQTLTCLAVNHKKN